MTNAITDKTDARPTFGSHATFDEYAGNYDQALSNGVSLSGESPSYFAEKRVVHTALWLHGLGAKPNLVADFGCGVGNSIRYLKQRFPQAELMGLDVSAASIERARQVHGDTSQFRLVDEAQAGEYDLIYSNGVFHHIAPSNRGEWALRLHAMLKPGGYLALWENNPWNPGTRMVMRRIPFDRDAIPLAATETREMLYRSGFEILGTKFCFYFPRVLSVLRGLERFGERIPFGAQYCVLARKSLNPSLS